MKFGTSLMQNKDHTGSIQNHFSPQAV